MDRKANALVVTDVKNVQANASSIQTPMFLASTPVSDDFYGGDFARISLPDYGATPPTNTMLCTLYT